MHRSQCSWAVLSLKIANKWLNFNYWEETRTNHPTFNWEAPRRPIPRAIVLTILQYLIIDVLVLTFEMKYDCKLPPLNLPFWKLEVVLQVAYLWRTKWRLTRPSWQIGLRVWNDSKGEEIAQETVVTYKRKPFKNSSISLGSELVKYYSTLDLGELSS